MASIEYQGIKFSGGKFFIILSLIGAIVGGGWSAYKFYDDYLDMKQQVQEFVAPDLSGFDKKIDLAKAEMDKRLELIEQQWSSIVHSCKQKMRSIPNKLAPILSVENSIEVCKNLLNKEIHLALDELSKNKEVPIADSEELRSSHDSDTEEVQTTKASNSK